MCSIIDTFNSYFGPQNVDIYGDGFKQKSLLLTLLEDYESSNTLIRRSLTEFLDEELPDTRIGMFANLAIYVHWPSVTVTNERHQSVEVKDLYAKIPIYPSGTLFERFTLSRATYTYEQYASGYMHSHVSGINSDPSCFMRPCLGTGPLNSTQNSLQSSSNDLWDLFCLELDRYVHVESIEGVPYRYLDRIGTARLYELNYDGSTSCLNTIASSSDIKSLLTRFFKYVLVQKKMKFAFSNGMYVSPYSKKTWVLKLSKDFLKFFAMINKLECGINVTLNDLMRDKLLIEVKMNNGKLYTIGDSIHGRLVNYMAFRNIHVLYFKGEDIRTHVDDPSNVSENTYYVLNPVLAFSFLDQCLNYLNVYEHEKNKHIIREENSEVIGDSSDSSRGSRSSNRKNSFVNYSVGEKAIILSI